MRHFYPAANAALRNFLPAIFIGFHALVLGYDIWHDIGFIAGLTEKRFSISIGPYGDCHKIIPVNLTINAAILALVLICFYFAIIARKWKIALLNIGTFMVMLSILGLLLTGETWISSDIEFIQETGAICDYINNRYRSIFGDWLIHAYFGH